MTVTCNAKKEPIASKYCFLAKSVINAAPGPGPTRTIGVIFGFNKTPDIAAQIDMVGRSLEKKGDYTVDETELTLLRICPVEVSDSVYIQFFDDADAPPEALEALDSLESIEALDSLESIESDDSDEDRRDWFVPIDSDEEPDPI
jgi:hypothetical protein